MPVPWGAVLPFAEDAFQVLRKGDVKNFFRKSNLGIAGGIGAAGKWWRTGVRPKGFWNWMGKTFMEGPAGFTYKGVMPFALPVAAYLGSKAGQGHSLSTSAGFLASMAPAGVGAMIAGGPGALAAGMLFGEEFGHTVRSKVQRYATQARRQYQFELGDYEDTEVAYTMRQRAVQEMSGSLLNARHMLGREAALMHS